MSDSPETEGTETWHRLHPMTLLQRFIVSLPGLILLILPVLGSGDPRGWLYAIFLGLYGFVAIPLMILHYLRFRFRIGRRELHINSGVLTRRHRSIPIERIQNVEIQQPMLARLTRTAKVRVETAGSAGPEGVLELVSLEMAHRLRDTIRSYQRELKSGDVERAPSSSAGTADSVATSEGGSARVPGPAEPRPELLYEMGVGRVLLSGVFRFSLVYIVLMFSGMEYLNIDPVEVASWFERGTLRPFADFAATNPGIAIVASVMAAALLAWVTGILVNLNRFYRFRLALDGAKLDRRQGLVTLNEAAIPLKRVQTYVLRTNPLMRRFGWWALDVQTMGLDASRRGQRTVVPFAQWDEVLAIVRRLEPLAIPGDFSRVSPLTIRRRLLRYTAVLVVAAAALATQWSWGWWVLVLWPMLLAMAYLQFRNHGYVHADEHLYVRSGVFRHQLWVLPRRKHQAFFASASFFQRRLGLRSVLVDSAGATGVRLPRIVDLPQVEGEAQFEDLYTRFRANRNSDGDSGLSRPSRGASPTLS